MPIIPFLETPLEQLTELEKERAIKKLHGETEELLGEMGQTSDEKALPTVQEYVSERDKLEKIAHQKDEEALKYFSRNKKTYQRYLLLVLKRFIKQEDIPKKYVLALESNDEGIVLQLEGTEYVGAFRVCGEPTYDINACKILAVQLGNTIGKLEGHFTQTASGIAIPQGAEAKLAMREIEKKWKHRK